MMRILLVGLIILFSNQALASQELVQGLVAKYVVVNDSFFQAPDPHSPQWNALTVEKIPLLPQNITTPSIYQTSVAALEVKALHNGEFLAVLLMWEDSTKHANVSLDHFSDACAIQLPVKGANETSPFMGNKEAPVAITHWKAIWQQDVDVHYQKVTDLYPNTWTDTYRFGKSVAIDARNPVSQTSRTTPVEELVAVGFGTLTTQEHQNAHGRGEWRDGKWMVMLTRPLVTKDKQDPVLKLGETTSMAFALWEGGHQDVGSRKNYAMWTPFVLEKK